MIYKLLAQDSDALILEIWLARFDRNPGHFVEPAMQWTSHKDHNRRFLNTCRQTRHEYRLFMRSHVVLRLGMVSSCHFYPYITTDQRMYDTLQSRHNLLQGLICYGCRQDESRHSLHPSSVAFLQHLTRLETSLPVAQASTHFQPFVKRLAALKVISITIPLREPYALSHAKREKLTAPLRHCKSRFKNHGGQEHGLAVGEEFRVDNQHLRSIGRGSSYSAGPNNFGDLYDVLVRMLPKVEVWQKYRIRMCYPIDSAGESPVDAGAIDCPRSEYIALPSFNPDLSFKTPALIDLLPMEAPPDLPSLWRDAEYDISINQSRVMACDPVPSHAPRFLKVETNYLPDVLTDSQYLSSPSAMLRREIFLDDVGLSQIYDFIFAELLESAYDGAVRYALNNGDGDDAALQRSRMEWMQAVDEEL